MELRQFVVSVFRAMTGLWEIRELPAAQEVPDQRLFAPDILGCVAAFWQHLPEMRGNITHQLVPAVAVVMPTEHRVGLDSFLALSTVMGPENCGHDDL